MRYPTNHQAPKTPTTQTLPTSRHSSSTANKSRAIRLSTALLAAAMVPAALIPAIGNAASNIAPATRVHPDQVRLRGTEVESIRGIETLSDWHTIDNQRLTLRVNHSKEYLLTLRAPCHRLRGAELVGVSMTNQEIWADYDHVAADGYECRIDTITQLGRRS